MQKNKILIAVATAVGVALPTFTILAQQDDEEPPEMGVFLTGAWDKAMAATWVV